MTTEQWKPIPDYEGFYEASTLGRIRRVEGITNNGHHLKTHLIKQKKQNNGYMTVMLSKNGETKTLLVHRLVAESFFGKPHQNEVVNHKDRDKTNNSVDNLEFCSQSYNVRYQDAHIERAKKLVNNAKTSKPIVQLTLDGELIKEWPSASEVERQFGYYQGPISRCCRGEGKQSYGYKWQYV